MSTLMLPLLHTLQTLYSGYLLTLTTKSISNLQKYEETSEKAAKYSNTAADQLRHTRTTQAAAATSITLSLVSSTTLLLTSPSSPTVSLLPCLLNTLALELARRHVSAFWAGKWRVPLPGTGEYNDAMAKTQAEVGLMAWLEASWLVVGVARCLL